MSKVILKTENITKRYGKNLVLDNINMTINEGDIYGFIGRNGAGKTTFMRVILNLTNRDGGKVELFENAENARLKIGSLIEDPGLYKNFTAYENMKRFAIINNVNDDNKLKELLKIVGLSNVGKKKVKNFSLGMRQRLGIAAALIHKPNVLILDEPTNGLDPEGIKEMRELLIKLAKEEKMAILISSHNLSELDNFVTDTCIIKNGVIVSTSSIKELKKLSHTTFKIELNTTKDVDKLFKEKCKIIDEDSMELQVEKDEITKCIDKLIKKDYQVYQVVMEELSLEDAFIQKTGGNVID